MSAATTAAAAAAVAVATSQNPYPGAWKVICLIVIAWVLALGLGDAWIRRSVR